MTPLKHPFLKTISLLFLCPLLASCDSGLKKHKFAGRTMGTTWHITVVSRPSEVPKDLQERIEARLDAINGSMSVFSKTSEITRFNDFKETGVPFEISKDFLAVMTVAEKIYRETGGAWDGTVGPVVDIWGFGKKERRLTPPPRELIEKTVQNTGFHFLEISPKGFLIKNNPRVHLDLGSIAKGYGVDQLTALLKESGLDRFIVEVGGEVVTSGRKMDGSNWRVGINTPSKDASATQVYKTVSLTGKAVATSGDYRNFFELNKKRYSHVIDPKTGWPVDNAVVSVTVIADSCTFADGLATAVMVMGAKGGMDLINRLEGVEGLIITQNPSGTFDENHSKNFQGLYGDKR